MNTVGKFLRRDSGAVKCLSICRAKEDSGCLNWQVFKGVRNKATRTNNITHKKRYELGTRERSGRDAGKAGMEGLQQNIKFLFIFCVDSYCQCSTSRNCFC